MGRCSQLWEESKNGVTEEALGFKLGVAAILALLLTVAWKEVEES